MYFYRSVYTLLMWASTVLYTHTDALGGPKVPVCVTGRPGQQQKKPQPAGNQVDFDAQLMMIIIVFFISFFFFIFNLKFRIFFKRKKS